MEGQDNTKWITIYKDVDKLSHIVKRQLRIAFSRNGRWGFYYQWDGERLSREGKLI